MARKYSELVSRSIYQISVVTFIASVVWISLGVYNAFNKPVETDVNKEVLEPLNPSIDEKVLESLEGRVQMGERVDELLQEAQSQGALTRGGEEEEEEESPVASPVSESGSEQEATESSVLE